MASIWVRVPYGVKRKNLLLYLYKVVWIAQMAEHWTENPNVMVQFHLQASGGSICGYYNRILIIN